MPMSEKSEVTLEQFNTLLMEQLPFAVMINAEAIELNRDAVILRARCDDRSLRPGGTVAGPVMMGLADAAFYGVVLAHIGMVALAVTTNLSINFLRKPGPGDLYCRAGALKVGKRLTVCDGIIYTDELGLDHPVAHVTGTYSIPPS